MKWRGGAPFGWQSEREGDSTYSYTPPSKTLITYKYSSSASLQKLLVLSAFRRKNPPFPRILGPESPFRITTNNSQGIIFVIIFDWGGVLLDEVPAIYTFAGQPSGLTKEISVRSN